MLPLSWRVPTDAVPDLNREKDWSAAGSWREEDGLASCPLRLVLGRVMSWWTSWMEADRASYRTWLVKTRVSSGDDSWVIQVFVDSTADNFFFFLL